MLEITMKIIRSALMTLVLVFPLLFVSVLAAGGQVRRKSLVTIEKVKDITLTWVKVAPANEAFAVWMPESPKVGREKLVIDQEPVILTYYGLIQDGTEYAVLSVSGLENKMADLAHMLMLNLYNKLIPTPLLDESERYEVAIKATYQRDISLNGYIGREYGIQAHNRTGLWRFYSVDKKFYAVAASTIRKDSLLINRVLNSFTLASSTPMANRTVPIQPQRNISARRALSAPSSSTRTWLVILWTFSKAARSKANQRLSLVRSLGYDANIADTDYYPNLKRDFLAVTMGPYSRSAANGVLNKVRSVAPGSYIKSGW